MPTHVSPQQAAAFDNLAILPPSFDFAKAMAAVQSVNDMERVVEDGEIRLRAWRVQTAAKMRTGFEQLEALLTSGGISKRAAAHVVLPLFSRITGPLDELLATYEKPFLGREGEVSEALAKLRALNGPAGRYVRKLVSRIEDIRIETYNAIVDMSYGLQSFRSEFEDPGAAESFSDGRSLGEFLRRAGR